MNIVPSKRVLSMMVLVGGLVTAIIITFGKDTAGSAINKVGGFVAGDKIEIPQNPKWQSEIETLEKGAKTESSNNVEEEAVTASVSQSLIANYLALKQSDDLNSESAQDLIEQTIRYTENATEANIITAPKLKIVADNGISTTKEYGENFGKIIKRNKSTKQTNEIIILGQALNSKDAQKLEELDYYVELYEKSFNELSAMPVPQSFVAAHTDILIGMQSIIFGLKKMRIVMDDPIQALTGIKTYQEGAVLFGEALQATLEYIKSWGVVYEQGTGGYYKFYGI